MKFVINTIFKLHILIYRYPCRSHIRLSIEDMFSYDLLWRVGMLYVCGEGIKSISEWFQLTEEEVVEILNDLVKGVYYE